MEVSEEQKRRIEANRASALARRNAKLQGSIPVDSKSSNILQHRPQSDVNKASVDPRPCLVQANLFSKENYAPHRVGGSVSDGCEKITVALEICAPNRFFVVVKSGRVPQDFLQSISSVSSPISSQVKHSSVNLALQKARNLMSQKQHTRVHLLQSILKH